MSELIEWLEYYATVSGETSAEKLIEAAARLRKLEAMREAAIEAQRWIHPEAPGYIQEDIDKTLTACGDDFYIERSKGFWWVTERKTKHNYAQTASKKRAQDMCRQLNAGRGLRDE